jgi:hypothetical protein
LVNAATSISEARRRTTVKLEPFVAKHRTFKDRMMQGMYDNCRRLNAEGKFQHEGPTHGTSHEAYWHGRRGTRKGRYSKNSLAYAAWAAGMDDAG